MPQAIRTSLTPCPAGFDRRGFFVPKIRSRPALRGAIMIDVIRVYIAREVVRAARGATVSGGYPTQLGQLCGVWLAPRGYNLGYRNRYARRA